MTSVQYRKKNGRAGGVSGNGSICEGNPVQGSVDDASKVDWYTSSAKQGRLLWWDEVPQKLAFNRYIASGYRSNITYGECACSLFSVHNETSNIWLHLGPALYVMFVAVQWMYVEDHPHKLAFFTVLIPELVCLLLSSAYHLFMAQVKHYDMWLKIDVCGVFGVMIVPYWASVWWGYHCQPFWRVAVLTTYYSIALASLVSATLATNVFARAVPMGLLVLIRVGSLVHRWVLGTCSPVSLNRYMLMEVVCTIGALINVYRVPERWLHSRQPCEKPVRKAQPLDLIGNSHNIMHCLAVLAMWCIYEGVMEESIFIMQGPSCVSR